MNPYSVRGMAGSNFPSKLKSAFTLIELLVVLAIIGVLIAFFFPAQRGSREAARRTQCKNNLKQIGLAMHNYHDAYGAFPPAYTVDAEGKPLHSWRTLLLPYMDQKPLYDKLDLSKAWDDPRNAEVFQSNPPHYKCPSSTCPFSHTTYMAVVTPDSVLRPEASCRLAEIKDGTSNTLLVIEVDAEHAVPWMTPQDVDEAYFLGVVSKAKTSHVGGLHGVLADGTVRFLSENLSADVRHALVTADGNETVTDF